MINLPLTELSETHNTITFGWTPVPCVGYVFYRNGVRVSNTWDPSVNHVQFRKANSYKVVALGVNAEGSYPASPLSSDTYSSDPYTSGTYNE